MTITTYVVVLQKCGLVDYNGHLGSVLALPSPCFLDSTVQNKAYTNGRVFCFTRVSPTIFVAIAKRCLLQHHWCSREGLWCSPDLWDGLSSGSDAQSKIIRDAHASDCASGSHENPLQKSELQYNPSLQHQNRMVILFFRVFSWVAAVECSWGTYRSNRCCTLLWPRETP